MRRGKKRQGIHQRRGSAEVSTSEGSLLAELRQKEFSVGLGAPEPNQSASFQLRRKPPKTLLGTSLREKAIEDGGKKKNPAAAKGIRMGGGTAVAETLSEQGDLFERRPRLLLPGQHFFVHLVPEKDFASLHAGGGAAASSGWWVVHDVGVLKPRDDKLCI